MRSGRVEAFSDGVIAILITVMVLELPKPEGVTWEALREVLPVLLAYLLSFVYLGIYWNNHHHMFQAISRVSGSVLWANLHLLFWLSLVPFATAWMSENGFAMIPTAVYGIVLLANGIAYFLLQRRLLRVQGPNSRLAVAIGRDLKGWSSPGLYILGIALSFVSPWLGLAVYVFVALMWLVPDRRVERLIEHEAAEKAERKSHEGAASA
ncbi:TMEM175 family protein [Naasia aerilata]|uniref:DUF1211 domain-containing protein n=1 Tax=Naasia aerilata TaxID=1162966 RepID=A0ABM8GAK5_9MICO|nr:TMEM175 family protein [Naasia aerilata]BDZ45248.1 hypothetical protein GCM10025866_11570 [Naasia aerilata]